MILGIGKICVYDGAKNGFIAWGGMLIILSVALCLLNVQAASAQGSIRSVGVTTFGAPSQFHQFLDRFQQRDGGYQLDSEGTSIYDADFMVIVADSRDDANFVPAILRPAFQKTVTVGEGISYFLPMAVFRGTLESDVQILIRDQFLRKLAEEIPAFKNSDEPRMLPCLMAGTVNSELSGEDEKFTDLFILCEGFIHG